MKFMTNIKTLAALLMAGAAFTACSSSDEIIEQPANPTAPKVYTMVIKASKGGDATTRALSLNGKTLNACWSGNETIEVYQNGEKLGTATAAYSPNGNTTITATLNPAPNPEQDLDFYLGGYTPSYTGQVGLLTGTEGNSISEKYDYAVGLIYSNAYTVDEISNTVNSKEGSLPLTFAAAQQAIIKFTLKNSDGSALPSNPSAFTVTDGDKTVELTSIPASTYTANGDGVLYVAFPASGQAKTITLTATVGSDTYTYTKSAVTFNLVRYYEITVKMTKQAPATTTVTWNSSNVFVGENENEKVRMCERTFEGIKMSSYGTESYLYPYDENYGTATLVHAQNETFTFTAPDGKLFTKIEIINNDDFEFEEYDDWTKPDDGKIEWNGDASNTVTLGGWESWSCLDLNSIVFTLKDE